MNKKPNKLLDASTAVSSYLDNLLQEATELPKSKIAEADHHNIHVLETPLTVAKQLTKENVIQISHEERHEENRKPEIEETTLSHKEQFNDPIQCLMFKVKGQLLAIPLIRMDSVVPFGERLTQLPYSPNYFKGLLKHRGNNIRVADTAALLFNAEQGGNDTDVFSPSHLLVFENNDWAISCDEILDVKTLDKDDIKWHSDENRLSFGTIKSSLALILSPEAIAQKLTNTGNSEKTKI